jgi:peptidoglycan glycosyltransferase
MNTQIRRLTALVMVMFLGLFAAVTYIQYGKAKQLRADGRNTRAYYDSFSRDRGPIVARDGTVLAQSKPVKDHYGNQRSYPLGPVYANITGYFSVLGSTTGMEKASDEVLKGEADSLFLSRLQDLVTGKEPTGGTIELTIDPAVQQAAWDALGEQRGAAVALDPKTGEILAMVSKPSFDPNQLAEHDAKKVDAAYKALEADPANPLYNRAIAGNLYAPGSTFKLVTAAAALANPEYTPDTELDAPSQLTLPGTSHKLTNSGDSQCSSTGKMTMTAALEISCNTAFGALGMELGQAALAQQAKAFGFGQDLKVPLSATKSTFPGSMDQAQLAMSAIGQFDVRVTPLQMAMVAAGIVNNGTVMEPYLVRTERDKQLNILSTTKPKELSQAMTPSSAKQLAIMMQGVVEDGSAGRAAVDGVTVGAKTGTAQKGEGQAPDVWTVGYGQAGGRAVAVAVVVEDGGHLGTGGFGGTVASPIVGAIIKAALNP